MSNYSTNELAMQEENALQSGPITLNDDRFPWREKKKDNLRMADLYDLAGADKHKLRAGGCSWTLKYAVSGVDTDEPRRALKQAMFCQLRCCPICGARKAKKAARQLSRVLDLVASGHPGCQFIFLTLTVQNCDGKDLDRTLKLLSDAWRKLIRHRPFERAVKGWFRAIEITRNRKTGEFHPHIHAILCVEADYFKKHSPIYLTHDKWMMMWQKALGVSYQPSVRIQRTTSHRQGKFVQEAVEAAKYAVKGSDFLNKALPIDEAASVLQIYTAALRGKRLVGFGGWLKDAVAELKIADDLSTDDLIHIDDDDLRNDISDLIEIYNWNFGVSDYILADSYVSEFD